MTWPRKEATILALRFKAGRFTLFVTGRGGKRELMGKVTDTVRAGNMGKIIWFCTTQAFG